MNQEKVGKFIAKCRKNKNLTQKNLADKLNVTDKAVSKWENGRCMPDINCLDILASELGVTINEIIRGEYINEEKIKDYTDENLKNSMIENKKTKNKLQKIKFILIIIIILIPLIILFFGEFLHTPNISFSSFKIMRQSKEFYQALSDYDYDKIEELISDNPQQWNYLTTGYTTQDFINNLKSLKSENIKFTSFTPIDFHWNGLFFVDYKMCLSNNVCIKIGVTKSNTENNKYLIGAIPINTTTDLTTNEKKIINIFNPIWFTD